MIRFAAGLALAAALALAPPALADTTRSSNWAGYAVHRPGLRFREVAGSWTEPSATCTVGEPTFSSVWVGLGGFSESSKALEQIGTEADCSAGGKLKTSAWFELVPAASRTIRIAVAPGDRMHASVTVEGDEVHLELADLTSHRTFAKTVHDADLDLTSADWIVEAPSECENNFNCQTLALADFGSATFSGAHAITAKGFRGSVSSHRWRTTRITLATGGRRFIGSPPASAAAGAAPSTLSSGGTSFTVTYSGTTTTTTDPVTPVTPTPVTSRPFLHAS